MNFFAPYVIMNIRSGDRLSMRVQGAQQMRSNYKSGLNNQGFPIWLKTNLFKDECIYCTKLEKRMS